MKSPVVARKLYGNNSLSLRYPVGSPCSLGYLEEVEKYLVNTC